MPHKFTHWNSFFYDIQENWCIWIYIRWKNSNWFKIAVKFDLICSLKILSKMKVATPVEECEVQHRRWVPPEQRPDTYPPEQWRWSSWQVPPVLWQGASLPVGTKRLICNLWTFQGNQENITLQKMFAVDKTEDF